MTRMIHILLQFVEQLFKVEFGCIVVVSIRTWLFALRHAFTVGWGRAIQSIQVFKSSLQECFHRV